MFAEWLEDRDSPGRFIPYQYGRALVADAITETPPGTIVGLFWGPVMGGSVMVETLNPHTIGHIGTDPRLCWADAENHDNHPHFCELTPHGALQHLCTNCGLIWDDDD